jgi:purine-nucleoside phosphorylase
MNRQRLDQAADYVLQRWTDGSPVAGMILGSGWSDVVEEFDILDTISYDDIPGLGRPGVAGHAGRLARVSAHGGEGWIFQGRRHGYEGEGWTPVALPVFVLKKAGIGTLLLTNAAGGIRGDLHPGELMALSDHINMMDSNPLIGPHDTFWGPRFPDQSDVYDPALRTLLKEAAAGRGHKVHEGVYLAGSGPTYETPAEIRAWQALGADAVGMSTVPEALLANACGMRVVALSCITNHAAGISDHPLTHEEVTDTTRKSMARMKEVVLAFWKEMVRGLD